MRLFVRLSVVHVFCFQLCRSCCGGLCRAVVACVCVPSLEPVARVYPHAAVGAWVPACGRYLKCWFWLDMLSTLPLGSVKALALVRIIRLLRVLKVLRLLKLSSLAKKVHGMLVSVATVYPPPRPAVCGV